MAKFHIGRNGKPAQCRAKSGNCPLGGESEHYGSAKEAAQAIVKNLEKEYGITDSASKKGANTDVKTEDVKSKVKAPKKAAKKTRKATSKPKEVTYQIPEGRKFDGYMGAIGWEGGNLIRLQKEKGSNYELSKEIREEIKNATKGNYLPKKIGNHDVKYSVRKDGYNAIYITATIKGGNRFNSTNVKPELYLKSHYGGRYPGIKLDAKLKNEINEIDDKLYQIGKSFRYNNSNSMVDYFDTNAYINTKTKNESSDYMAPYDSYKSMHRKAVNKLINDENGYHNSTLVLKRQIENDPNLRKAFDDYKYEQRVTELSRQIDKEVYDFNDAMEKKYAGKNYDSEDVANDPEYSVGVERIKKLHAEGNNIDRSQFDNSPISDNDEDLEKLNNSLRLTAKERQKRALNKQVKELQKTLRKRGIRV